ncbi:polysaccharide deacetylase family protein [Paenibacillus sp. YIM B09110]|uniref:polysaccharide deacetylase family protein n=1 Tax=Paenibacillus sp. YIM B09110 TaxID=3126102 RepID=UPI00301C9BD3
MTGHKGQFVISLDFELFWGIRDLYDLDWYNRTFAKERELIPEVLTLFEKYGIHATWATVGLLFFESKEAMLNGLPSIKPGYVQQNLSPYPYLKSEQVGLDEKVDPNHYASSLIHLIRNSPFQAISTHTFSHYYCKEEGQTEKEFAADIQASIQIAEKQGMTLESIVFPRNQINETYLPTLNRLGIKSYRGNPKHWIYRHGYSTKDSLFLRAARLLDTYINLSGYHCYRADQIMSELPVNLPASHFFRSYSPKLRVLEPFRIKRILDGMTYAAKHNQVYHLWWHPYNLASNANENMDVLKRILEHYHKLQHKYGMTSLNMEELCNQVLRSEEGRSSYQSQH